MCYGEEDDGNDDESLTHHPGEYRRLYATTAEGRFAKNAIVICCWWYFWQTVVFYCYTRKTHTMPFCCPRHKWSFAHCKIPFCSRVSFPIFHRLRHSRQASRFDKMIYCKTPPGKICGPYNHVDVQNGLSKISGDTRNISVVVFLLCLHFLWLRGTKNVYNWIRYRIFHDHLIPPKLFCNFSTVYKARPDYIDKYCIYPKHAVFFLFDSNQIIHIKIVTYS